MADKKLNAVDSATTVANFYGNNGGKDVQIPLAAAASVLADVVGIKHYNIQLSVGDSQTIETKRACTIFINENSGAIISGVINKRMQELNIIKGAYIGTSENGSEALLIYPASDWNITIKNNFTSKMTISLLVIY